MNEIGLSIIVPTHKRPRLVEKLLHSISTLDRSGIALEIIVVSNLEDPSTKLLIESYGDRIPVKYLVSNVVNVSYARNFGLDMALNDLCAFLDDDCEVLDPNWLQTAVKLFRLDANLTGAGGYYSLSEQINLPGIAYHIKMRSWLKYFNTENGNAKRLVGGSLVLKKSKMGNRRFDPKVKFGGSETSLIVQLNSDEKKMVLTESLSVRHHFKLSVFDFIKKSYLQGKYHQVMLKQTPEQIYFSANNFIQIENEVTNSIGLSWMQLKVIGILMRIHRIAFYQLPKYF